MQTLSIKVQRTARYCLLGNCGPDVEQVWFVLHGYGHLAAQFLRNFKIVSQPGRLIVAPEGLSRFYLNGVSGKIGASWMTGEARTHEIDDYIAYLDAVMSDVMARLPRADVKVGIFGFSQGTATACRWILKGQVRAGELVLWGGLYPKEVVVEAIDLQPFRQIRTRIVIGDDDEFVPKSHIEKQKEFVRQENLPCEVIEFSGNHRIYDEILQSVISDET